MRSLARLHDVRLIFEGRVPNEQLAPRLSEFEYFVIPSLYEGLPKSLVEAMSAGLVCIGTDVAGIRDLIVDGVTGYLATRTDEASIAAAIDRATSAKENRSIVENARRFVLEHHSVDAYVEREMGRMRSSRT